MVRIPMLDLTVNDKEKDDDKVADTDYHESEDDENNDT